MPLPKLFKGMGGGRDKKRSNTTASDNTTPRPNITSSSVAPAPSTSNVLSRTKSPTDILDFTGHPKTSNTINKRTLAPLTANGVAPAPNPVSRFTEHETVVPRVPKTPEPARPTASPPPIVMPKPRPSLVPTRRILKPEHFDKTQVESEDEGEDEDEDGDVENVVRKRNKRSSSGVDEDDREDSPEIGRSRDLAPLGGNLANVQLQAGHLLSSANQSKLSTSKNSARNKNPNITIVVPRANGSENLQRKSSQGQDDDEPIVSPLSEDSLLIPPTPKAPSKPAYRANIGIA
ncbi:hypothetical protein BC938DRAFT_483963, partial [Jimgerdemannia flammicorona]